MKKVDKRKKNNLKKKKTLQTKKRKSTKKVTPPKNKVAKKTLQKNSSAKTQVNKTNNKVVDIKNKIDKEKENKIVKVKESEEKTKTIIIPKIKENILSLTKSITLPKLKSDKKLSLTKSITIPKIKDNYKKLSLTKSITLPKLRINKNKNLYEINENIDNDVELDLSDDKCYKTAENLYKNKKYEEAYNIYLILLDKYKKDKRLYKRLINTLTKDYTYKDNSKEFKKVFEDFITTYKLLANKKEIKSLEYNLEAYKNVKITKRRSKFLLIAFLGIFGIHRFIEKKFISGFIYLITLGFLGIGVIVDLINDYAEYEDTLQLDLLRYIISFGILILGILNKDLEYFYLIVIASVIFLPVVYSYILKYIPGFIKVIGMIVLIYFGFQTEQIAEYVPSTIIGNWITTNESTNYEELKIELEKTTLTFDDREEEIGKNEFDSQNKILRVIINDTKVYKFLVNIEDNKICSYTESKECIIEFTKS